jgi:hypothetical protein
LVSRPRRCRRRGTPLLPSPLRPAARAFRPGGSGPCCATSSGGPRRRWSRRTPALAKSTPTALLAERHRLGSRSQQDARQMRWRRRSSRLPEMRSS